MLERGIKQLIAQALDSKAKVFQTRIEGVVQNYIYTQQHPQAQEKQNRKHKTLDEKEDTKSSSSDIKHDVISDISQLIPIPGLPATVAKTTETADKKLGVQDSSKSGSSSKSFQTVKKSSSAQGKSTSLARGEETRTGSPVNERVQADDSSRTKDGKSKTARAKVESLSRDDGRNSPKVEDSSHKMNKTTKVKVESTNLGENCAPFVVENRSNLRFQGDISSLYTERNENSNPIHLLPVAEEMVLEVKTEKESESKSTVTWESKVKVKEEKSEISGAREENLSKNIPRQQKEEVKAGSDMKVLDDCIKQEHDNILLDEVPKLDTGAQRNDSFQTAKMVEEIPEGQGGNDVKPGVDGAVPPQNENKMQESVGRLEPVMEPAEKVDTMLDTTGDEKSAVEAGEVTQSSASGHSGMKATDLPAAQGGTVKAVEELQSDTKLGAADVITPSDELWRQTLPDESQELQSRQKENPVKSESGLEKPSSVASSMAREDLGQASSTGEYSDGESDISEVSSVHTSDLSSFDEEISSGSESYDEDEGTQEGDAPERREQHTDGGKEQTNMPQSEQDSDAMPRRRSTRISSRRSTKEGESEISENEASRKESRDFSRKRRHGEKRNKKPRPEFVKGQQSESGLYKPRRRGRPRKDDKRTSSHSDSQTRRPRTHHREDGSTAAERSGSDSRESRSTRSQRQIKRTRCYSPSSEGTREVFLPRKRSRDDPT